MSPRSDLRPCAGVRVVEVAIGTSDLGLGLAGGVPGMLLSDLGATVTRVVGTTAPAIDRELTWTRAWHREKQIIATDSADDVRALLADADVALVYGREAVVEGRALGARELLAANPALVYVRCRPSRTDTGEVDDWGLLVEAESGFCTQLAGHRDGPIFVDARATGIGTSHLLTTSALALLVEREHTGRGGWAETSLYDGMLSTLGCMIGRSARAPEHVESYWEHGSTFPNFLYRCADGELIQVWFGGKGMYAKLLEVLGDEPSEEGYYSDQTKGKLQERAIRWRDFFVRQPRDVWIERLRAEGVPCEPVFMPGEALADPHLHEIGLALPRVGGQHGEHEDLVVGAPIEVARLVSPPASPPPASVSSEAVVDDRGRAGTQHVGNAEAQSGEAGVPTGALQGLRVLDFSAFVAGPLGAQVLADLGADVIKVEPLEGEAMRAAAYAVAACQRGKRSVALDLNAEAARPVVERLLQWADVVLHNFRVGVSARLGIDEATVARLNPRAVYCHASGFGTYGPRAPYPSNDALMQAVTGLERAVGGEGNDPLAPTWIPIDMSGGWITAIGILAGLFARARDGHGHQVATSLLGAGMLMLCGVYQRDGALVPGPQLDGAQTGYGPGYRIYECGDGSWLAPVLPDVESWEHLRALVAPAAWPSTYAPLRGGTDDAAAREAEATLEQLFASAPRDHWLAELDQLGIPVAAIEPRSRDEFRRGILDDPVNRQLGRVTAYDTADWGYFEQIGPLLRMGPAPSSGPPLLLPGVGEHTTEVLKELGFTDDEISALLATNAVRQQ